MMMAYSNLRQDLLEEWDCGEGVCGALCGGIMSLSYVYGRENFNVRAIRCYSISKELYGRFKEEYNALTCVDVQKNLYGRKFNLWDREEYKEFEKDKSKCAEVAGNVAKWTAEIISQHGSTDMGAEKNKQDVE